ncbi:MAG TPA: hypothetical protein VF502_11120 [Stellaceae bacterium]
MKPKQLLTARLQEHIVPFMGEHGFRFSKSQLRFTRSVGRVRHEIVVCSDRYNSADSCTFWTMWSASTPEYLEWHQGRWNDEKPRGDTLASLADWNIPGWSRAPADPRCTLTNTPGDAAVMASLRADIERIGLPFLARVSTWEGAAERLRRERWMYDRAADFLLIAGRREEARATLLEGIHTFEVLGRPDTFQELPRLKRRLARYFGGE